MTADVAVEVKIADAPQFQALMRQLSAAAESFATLSDEELAALPAAAREGIGTLTRAAGETPAAEPPGEIAYRGDVIIEWPPPRQGYCGLSPVRGYDLMVLDAVTGKPVLTVSRVEIHADANGLVTADITMWADPDGEPLTDTSVAYKRGDKWLQGTYPFYVAAMTVRESADPKAVGERIKASGVHYGRTRLIELPDDAA